MRTCEVNDCSRFVFGTDKNTRIGYCKNHQTLRTDISHESIAQRALKKQKANALKKDSGKVRSIAIDVDSGNKEMADKHKSKSDLLKQADKVFGDWIKKRDSSPVIDEETGDVVDVISCPCCGKTYGLEDTGEDGKKIVQPLHFVSRGVYDLRFDPDNVFAGDSYCNLRMHLNPKGKEYQNYRRFLVGKFGEAAVSEIELVKRKINKIEESQLRTVIEHYSQ